MAQCDKLVTQGTAGQRCTEKAVCRVWLHGDRDREFPMYLCRRHGDAVRYRRKEEL